MSIVSRVKNLLVSSDVAARTVKAGPFRGISLMLDLRNRSQLYWGLWEREVYSALTTLSGGVRTAIDIGTAEGEYLLYFLKSTKAETVFGFEPDPSVLARLYTNLTLNGIASNDPRLEMRSRFVGLVDDEQTCTLDLLMPDVRFPCIVKVDVDGAEVSVLSGAQNLLEERGVRLIIETHSAALEAECIDLLLSKGHAIRIIRNAWWRRLLPENRASDHNRWLAASNEQGLLDF